MTLPLNHSAEQMALCSRQQELDRIACQAIASGLTPRETIALLDTIARWQSLGYCQAGNASIETSVASLFAPPDSAPVRQTPTRQTPTCQTPTCQAKDPSP